MTNRELLIFLSNQGYFDVETHFQKPDVEIRHEWYFKIDKDGNITNILKKSNEWVSVTDGMSAREWFEKMEKIRKDIENND